MQQHDNLSRLRELTKELLVERKLILASNRGPVEYSVGDGGNLQARRGSGGVVTALTAASQYAELTWVACAMGEGDRQAAAQAEGRLIRSPLPGQNLNVRFVTPARGTFHKYYNEFCNPLLWFLQHYMWNSPHAPNVDARMHDAWNEGYVPVNQTFAEAVAEEARDSDPPPFIMLHDYHLYLAGGYIRSRVPGAILQHFIHIPWPAPRYWQLLPAAMRQAIWENLCANDIVGVQTQWDVRNFLHTCQAFLPDAEVDYRSSTVWYKGHLTRVNAYPISIDVEGLQRLARSSKVREYEAKLSALCGEATIVRVDRLEPSKNVLRGFRAFDILLQRYPQFLEKVKFLTFLVPSRTNIRQYQRYAEDVMALVNDINRRRGSGAWRPIEVFHENNYPQAIAAMRLYDVLLVNAVIDGMNLVAKEGVAVNNRNGVLILSETVGAHEQLGEYALSIGPADIEGTAQAMYQAMTMPQEERKRRAQALRSKVQDEDITLWLCRQFEDLLTLA